MDNHTHHSKYRNTEASRGTDVSLGAPRRQQWNAEERARIVAESFAPGAKVSAVALRHGVRPGLLHLWRRKAKASQAKSSDEDQPILAPLAFIPVTMREAKPGHEPPRKEPPRLSSGGLLEIEIDGALIKIPKGADRETLRFVLAELRRAP